MQVLQTAIAEASGKDLTPIRIVLNEEKGIVRSEIGVLCDSERRRGHSIGDYRQRGDVNSSEFNAVMVLPTGIGAELGGHAGDACPVARLLAQACDKLVLHPNVVNASDLNELPENSLYVEGSVLARLMMGTAGLSPVRSNRILLVIDAHKDSIFVDAAINAANAARSSIGIDIVEVVTLDPPVRMRARFTNSGRAAGRVEELEYLCKVLDERAGSYDAIALSSVIDVPHEFHKEYFDAHGSMVNPWGGIEAIFTHCISSLYNLPSAHSPMFENREVANMDVGMVDPRMAAEAVSMTFLNCILKGLHKSPRIVTDINEMRQAHVLSAEDVSVLIQPDGCLGIPTIAALEQGIAVIAVRENATILKNDLSVLPWAPGQLHIVENYWEAAGLMLAMRAGILPAATRRPLEGVPVTPEQLGGVAAVTDDEASAVDFISNE